ncbi:MAG: RNA polymerase sigma factor [Pseudomonadota bacterium]
MEDGQSDAWLIERAQAGDAPAFARLLERHYDFIHGVAWRWSGSVADAEDIAQEVAIKLATALKGFRGDAALRSWLYRLTLNATRDRQRAEARRETQIAQLAFVHEESAPADQSTGLEAQDLWAAVRALPARQRDAVLLVYAEELSHAEAAEIMGCAETTVSWNIHAAKKKLRVTV